MHAREENLIRGKSHHRVTLETDGALGTHQVRSTNVLLVACECVAHGCIIRINGETTNVCLKINGLIKYLAECIL